VPCCWNVIRLLGLCTSFSYLNNDFTLTSNQNLCTDMKTLLYRMLLIVPILIMVLNISAQEEQIQYEGEIVAGSNRTFKITFMDDETVKAKILSLDGEMVTIKKRDGTTQIINRDYIKFIEAVPMGSIGSVGAGFGVPYGTLGINLEINLLPYLSLSGGLGTTVYAGVGWSAGARGYFRKPGPMWRPRISAFYGINAVYAEDLGNPNNKSYPGVTIGLGQMILWKRHGFDLDIMYVVNSRIDNEHPEDYSKVKINIGYRFAF